MQQLVRVMASSGAQRTRLTPRTATRRQQGATNVDHRPGGYSHCALFSSHLEHCLTFMPQHETTSSELVSRIRNNARRYVTLFSEVVDKLMPQPTKDISDQDEVIDVILHQRRERNEHLEAGQDGFPEHLLRR